MKKILFLLTAALALVLLLVPAAALASTTRTANIAIDGTPTLKNIVWPAQQFSSAVRHTALEAGVLQHDLLDPDLILTLYDNTPGHQGPYLVPFWKEYVGLHSDIYVGWNDLASGPDSVQQDQTITADQVKYVGQQFDQRIWESDVFHFGNYNSRSPRPEIDGKRAAIFVHNIRDEAYWGPYRFYTAGYFTSGLNNEQHLNAIFIDSFNWKNRLGVNTTTPSLSYLYEGVVAHEFQHLIHQDIDPNEADFINEGMAEIAMQFIYGTSTTAGEIGEALVYHRDSLTDWKSELFDYGNSCLWQDYLWERMGGGVIDAPLAGRVTAAYADNKFADTPDKFTDPGDKFIWNLIHDQASGLAGVANWVGGPANVEALHRDFTLANLLDGKVAEPNWNYRNLVLGGADSDGYSIDDGIAYYKSNVNGNVPPTRKNVRRLTVTEPWGAYYRTYGGQEPGVTMSFTGGATDGVAAHSLPTQWYSSLGNMLNRTLARRIDLVPAGATLSFWTWFDIEPDWDYGYVEASTDGVKWTKLTQTSSTLPVGVDNINGSSIWDGPGGLTGVSGGWQQANFSLGGLSGSVYVRFRYATDDAFNGVGWYVDDISLNGFSDPVDTTNGWTTDGWLFTSGMQNNDWTVDAWVPYAKAGNRSAKVESLVGLDGQGTKGQLFIDSQFQKSFRIYGIVSNRPDGPFSSTGRLVTLKQTAHKK